MEKDLFKIVETIRNPVTGATLGLEGRLKNVTVRDGQCWITYQRDGIDAKQKLKIEQEALDALKEHFPEEKIFVETVSQNSPHPKAPPPQQEAPSPGPASGQRPLEGARRVWAMASGKGGVGKSTVAANVAVAMAATGKKVGLIDGDIYGPSQTMLFGLKGRPPVARDKKKIQPFLAHGVSLISFGSFLQEHDPVIWRGPMLGKVLSQFLFGVDWGMLDYLFVDMPPGTGDVHLSLCQLTHVHGAIIISTPQDVALADSRKGLEMFRQVQVPIIGVIENMSHYVCHVCHTQHDLFGRPMTEQMARGAQAPILGRIPFEPPQAQGANEGLPYMANRASKGLPGYRAYLEVVKKLSEMDDCL